MPGLFLSLDGIDGTGKSTQCRLLADWLRGLGRTVTLTHEPGGTILGNEFRSILLGHRGEMTVACEMFLFMASRSELVTNVIRPALADGQVVISDRFVLASVVYQGHAGGLPPDRVREIGQTATDGLDPDLTLILDLPVPAALTRRGRTPDRMEAKGVAFQEAVREGFLTEARRLPAKIAIVDASPDASVVHLSLRRAIEPLLRANA